MSRWTGIIIIIAYVAVCVSRSSIDPDELRLFDVHHSTVVHTHTHTHTQQGLIRGGMDWVGSYPP